MHLPHISWAYRYYEKVNKQRKRVNMTHYTGTHFPVSPSSTPIASSCMNQRCYTVLPLFISLLNMTHSNCLSYHCRAILLHTTIHNNSFYKYIPKFSNALTLLMGNFIN